MLGFDTAYLCKTFDHCNFSRTKDMVGAHHNLNGLRDLTMLLSGMICHPWALPKDDKSTLAAINLSTKFDVSYLHPLSRYERQYEIL